MPTSSQPLRLLRTYTSEAGSFPTMITARPGGRLPLFKRAWIRSRTSLRRLVAMVLPSIIFAVMGSGSGRIVIVCIQGRHLLTVPRLRQGIPVKCASAL